MRIVLENLLGNALKFSAGSAAPRIAVGCEEQDRGEGSEAVFYVRDNGIGFDMAYADKLFKVFERLHAGEGYAGTGIGLATVQRIVTDHGGRVWARSQPGQGAVFYFTVAPPLPRTPAQG
jgi:signal transduction histidine kinase